MILRKGLTSDALLAFAILALLGVIAARLNREEGPDLVGNFRVVDGDTLRSGDRRVRLKGIDAPELLQSCQLKNGAQWPCGEAAKRHLQGIVRGGGIACRGLSKDRYGRILADCRQGSLDINARMVRDGMAVAYGGYKIEESQARSEERGLWAGTFEMPGRYRAEERQGWMSHLFEGWGF